MNIHNKIIAGLMLVASLMLGGCQVSPAASTPSAKIAPAASHRFGAGGYGNTIFEIQCNTTAITTSTSGFGALSNATAIPPGKYSVTFTNTGSVQVFYSLDGVHVAGIIPANSSRTDNNITITSITFTIYIERDPTQSSNVSGLYVDGHQLF